MLMIEKSIIKKEKLLHDSKVLLDMNVWYQEVMEVNVFVNVNLSTKIMSII